MQAKKKAEKWLDLVRKKPVAFGIESGFDKLGDLHNQWLKEIILGAEDMTIQAHRGSYKTTVVSISIALMMVLYPNIMIFFIRKTDSGVKEIVLQVGKLLRTPIYKALAKALYGKNLRIVKQNALEIDTNLKLSPRGVSQLTASGTNGALTGQHYDLIITDDIVTLEDRQSKAERERTCVIYDELQNIKNPGGRFVNLGTPWHKEDAFKKMPNISRYDCYTTGMLSTAEIHKLQSSMDPSVFAANYELKHIASQDALFTAPKFYTGPGHDIENGIGHIDAAYGGQDSTAFTIVKRSGEDLLVFGKKWRKHVDDCLPEIMLLHQEYKAGTVHNETNADKGYLSKALDQAGIPPGPYHENQNKYIKISTILKGNWERIKFIDGTDPEYIQEILDYTENAQHDDAPDSLASAVKIINRQETKNKPEEQIQALRMLGL